MATYKIKPNPLGVISFSLPEGRMIASSGDFRNHTDSNGGVLASNSFDTVIGSSGALKITRVNGATDISSRITWIADVVDPIQWEAILPDDLDDTVDGTLYLTVSMSGVADTPVATIAAMVGIGGSNIGGNTSAVSGTTPTVKTIALNFPSAAAGSKLTIAINPAAHATDSLRLDALRLVYTRR